MGNLSTDIADDPYASTGGTVGVITDSKDVGSLFTHGADIGAADNAKSDAANPGFWNTAKDWVETKEDELLFAYSKTDTSANIDVALPKVQSQIDKLADAANKYAGYFSDPDKIQGTLDTVKWILIAGTVLYALTLIAPVVKSVTR